MDISHTCLLCLLIVSIKTSTAQFMALPRKASKLNACEGPNKTALVEHFFNVIFTEFQNNPPVCICVQMCTNQPTYCYPNGCLKKIDSKKKTLEENRPPLPVTNLQNDDINTMFLVENDFSHLLNENVEINKNTIAEKFSIKDIRPDPFKDRYKSLFKYKKMPKVELRYNLREQVKNMKSDILKVETQDVSKTRWPKNNHKIIHEQQQLFHGDKSSEGKAPDGSPGKFFIQGPEIERDMYSPKFFKRDLRRNNPGDNGHSENESEIPDPLDPKTFSLETLIENLLGNRFDRKPDDDIEFKQDLKNSKATNKDGDEKMTADKEPNNNNTKPDKEITCVMSLNMTNENLDENKYEESPVIKKHLDKWKNYTFNEMIAALSKQIDKQNNTSLDIMKNASKDKIEVTITGPIKNLKEKDNLKIIEEIEDVKKQSKANLTDTKYRNSTELTNVSQRRKALN